METAHDDFDALSVPGSDKPIHQAMLSGDPPGPPSAQIALQRFRLTDPGKPVTLDVGNQTVYSTQDHRVGFLPMQIVLPTFLRAQQVHSIGSWRVSLPAS